MIKAVELIKLINHCVRNLCKNKSNKNFCNYFEVSETNLFWFQFHNLCAWTWKGREKCLKPYSLTPKGVYFDRSTLAQSSKFGWTHFEDNVFKNIRFFSYENKLFHTHSGICRLENLNLLFSKGLEMLWT